MYVGYVNGDAAVMLSVGPQPGLVNNLYRVQRAIVLPDFQGLGLFNIMMEWCGEYYSKKNKLISSVSTHPSILRYYMLSDRWKLKYIKTGINSEYNYGVYSVSTRIKFGALYIPKNKKIDLDINI